MKISVFLMTCFLLTGTVYGRDHSKHEKGEYLKKELGLTDEQYVKVKAFKEASQKELRTMKESLNSLRKDFKEAMKNTASTTDELKQKFDKFQKARDEYQRARFNKMLNMRGVLTPEQLEKFSKAMEKNKGKWDKKRKNR